MKRRRHLSDEEQALWAGFARSIKPLGRATRQRSSPPAEAAAEGGAGGPVQKGQKPVPTAASRHGSHAVPPAPPLSPFGRRLRQRVARGHEEIDARLDLHGKTQAQAHAALLRFLRRAQADGARIVLIVTGKGAGRARHESDGETGVLRRQVPQWLSLPEFRSLVVGFDAAHIGHGGDGALYVRVRRGR